FFPARYPFFHDINDTGALEDGAPDRAVRIILIDIPIHMGSTLCFNIFFNDHHILWRSNICIILSDLGYNTLRAIVL
ncbi:MAG: hypothetical protein NZ842_12870, partial [Dehalococcoidia bacterium]|nr:hypothetical protein [Dehalococcoidia bacterium]